MVVWDNSKSIVYQCLSKSTKDKNRIGSDDIIRRNIVLEDYKVKKNIYKQLNALSEIALEVREIMKEGADNISVPVYYTKDENIRIKYYLISYFKFLYAPQREEDTLKGIKFRRYKKNKYVLVKYSTEQREKDKELAYMYLWYKLLAREKMGSGECRHFAMAFIGALVEHADKLEKDKALKNQFYYYGYLDNDHQVVLVTSEEYTEGDLVNVKKLREKENVILVDLWISIQPPVLFKHYNMGGINTVKIRYRFTVSQMVDVRKVMCSKRGPKLAYQIRNDWEDQIENDEERWRHGLTANDDFDKKMQEYKDKFEGIQEYYVDSECLSSMKQDLAIPEKVRDIIPESLNTATFTSKEFATQLKGSISIQDGDGPGWKGIMYKGEDVGWDIPGEMDDGERWDSVRGNYFDIEVQKRYKEYTRNYESILNHKKLLAKKKTNDLIQENIDKLLMHAEEGELKRAHAYAFGGLYLGAGRSYYHFRKKGAFEHWKAIWDKFHNGMQWADKIKLKCHNKTGDVKETETHTL